MTSTMTLEDIYSPIENRLTGVTDAILEILSSPNELAEEVIRYFFSGKGKLLRPALTFLGAELKAPVSGKEKEVLHLASSFEIFHAATLIHDDIIDSAYLRRNLPTINVKWGAETAVLVGDYLHDKAIGAIFKNGGKKVINLFLETAGLVCDGEIHELKEKGNLALSEKEYIEIVDKKTAVLLACCLQAGAVWAGASAKEVKALAKFGHAFGIAFQIVDDCLDFMGQENEFGKTLGADCAAGVLTLPLIRLLQIADPSKKAEVLSILRGDSTPEKFQTLLDLIRNYETIDYSLQKAREYTEQARKALAIFPDNPARRSLENLLDYVLIRNK